MSSLLRRMVRKMRFGKERAAEADWMNDATLDMHLRKCLTYVEVFDRPSFEVVQPAILKRICRESPADLGEALSLAERISMEFVRDIFPFILDGKCPRPDGVIEDYNEFAGKAMQRITDVMAKTQDIKANPQNGVDFNTALDNAAEEASSVIVPG